MESVFYLIYRVLFCFIRIKYMGGLKYIDFYDYVCLKYSKYNSFLVMQGDVIERGYVEL